MGVWERKWGIYPHIVSNEMLESRRVCYTWSQSIQSPQLVQGSQDAGVRVLATVVDSLVLDNSLANPRRNQQGRNTDAKTLEIERGVLAIIGQLRVGEVIAGWHVDWGGT